MIKKIRKKHSGFRFLTTYWSKHCMLEAGHIAWILRHVEVVSSCRKHEALYLQGDTSNNVYLVARGLLARATTDDNEQRRLLNIATPGMALMTTKHLYSSTPSQGDIIVLQPNSIILAIPYRAIKEFREQEPCLNTLINIIANKKKEQFAKMRLIPYTLGMFETYRYFADHLPELHRILTHQEVADLLGISLSTVERSSKKWLHL